MSPSPNRRAKRAISAFLALLLVVIVVFAVLDLSGALSFAPSSSGNSSPSAAYLVDGVDLSITYQGSQPNCDVFGHPQQSWSYSPAQPVAAGGYGKFSLSLNPPSQMVGSVCPAYQNYVNYDAVLLNITVGAPFAVSSVSPTVPVTVCTNSATTVVLTISAPMTSNPSAGYLLVYETAEATTTTC